MPGQANPILLIGAGRMGLALLKGWASAKIGPVVAVEPAPSAELKRFAAKNKITLLKTIEKITRARACVIAIKPQILSSEAPRLSQIAKAAPMISIAAGVTTASLGKAWGRSARIIRAMPNTPGAIGKGITGLYATPAAKPADVKLADKLLSSLGETVWVKSEKLIDSVTAVSGSGPAYVFLLVEALTEAGIAEGLAPALAEKLARATVSGSGALIAAEKTMAADLRKAVTSPGGTTEAALRILMDKDGLVSLMKRAVSAARQRAEELGK
jgi:pyrroline-5-carboxylate reductase